MRIRLFESDAEIRRLERQWRAGDESAFPLFLSALKRTKKHYTWNKRKTPLPFGTPVVVILSYDKMTKRNAKISGHRRGNRGGWVYDLHWDPGGMGGSHEDFVIPRIDVVDESLEERKSDRQQYELKKKKLIKVWAITLRKLRKKYRIRDTSGVRVG